MCVTEDADLLRRKLFLTRLWASFSAVGICCLFPIIIELICHIFKAVDLYQKNVFEHSVGKGR